MAQIIEFRMVQPRPSTPLAKQCCLRCGADVWHISKNWKIQCADCEEVCHLRLQQQVQIEHIVDHAHHENLIAELSPPTISINKEETK